MATQLKPLTFVRVRDNECGVGKVLSIDGNSVELEYFISPAGPRVSTVWVLEDQLDEVELSAQTRIFWHDEKNSTWRSGRVDGGLVSAEALRATEDHYHVRFPNGVEGRIPVSQLYVRWARPIEDPTEYLAHRITDTPYFFVGRSQIARSFAEQRAAFGGLSGLVSSAVELLEHQVTIVRRVLGDPIFRYLLADEVGLGKTIEAGVLIRQHLLDLGEDAHVLIVAPGHLVTQWRTELSKKFFLGRSSCIDVISYESLSEFSLGINYSLLVVDEAQRPALTAFSADASKRKPYSILEGLALGTPRVLLLSGTPVLHQEDGFLAMLHLLDPGGYPLADREAFKLRIKNRQFIANAISDLTDDASFLFVEEALDGIENLDLKDSRLKELISELRKLNSDVVNAQERTHAISAIRTYLVETYRLHRRMLRTRRDDPRVCSFLPTRKGADIVTYEDRATTEAFDFLEAWRRRYLGSSSVADSDPSQLFATWVDAALSHPRVLLDLLKSRLGSLTGTVSGQSGSVFDREEQFLSERITLLEDAQRGDERATTLSNWLKQNDRSRKIVIFVDNAAVADELAIFLKSSIGDAEVARHSAELNSAFWESAESPFRILVCDGGAEEGLNFQRIGATLVHYDLPLEPARLEQRIGRVDRIEAKGRMRNVVLLSGCVFEKEWATCVLKAIRVFERSIAPLQYVLLEGTARIRTRLLSDGTDAIEQAMESYLDPKAGLDAELRKIRAQEVLDSSEFDSEFDRTFFEQLQSADDGIEEAGADLVNAWVVSTLQFIARETALGAVQYVYDTHRPTLFPVFEAASRFAECLDFQRRSRHELPLRPATFSRSLAEKHATELLRVGHPFVTALESLVRSDDRGTAFAFWRNEPKFEGTPRLFFRFDFFIEASATTIESEIAHYKDMSLEAIRRRADQAFQTAYQTVWLDSDLEEVTDPSTLAILRQPYSKGRRPTGGSDTNLRWGRWELADRHVPASDWSDLCFRARRSAESLVRNSEWLRSRITQSVKVLGEESARTQLSLSSRIARLGGAARLQEEKTAKFEQRLSNALAKGVLQPDVRPDSVGVVIVARFSLEPP